MIITCEKCNARYLLASLLLGVGGRKVRCGVCGHEWFQPPVDDPFGRDDTSGTDTEDDGVLGPEEEGAPDFKTLLDDADVIEAIPEGVLPIPEGSSVPTVKGFRFPWRFDRAAINGLGAACVILLLIVGAAVVLRAPIVTAWQPAALPFETAGIAPPVPGEGLIFDRVEAVARPGPDGSYTLALTGNVINLHAREAVLPRIRATLRDKDGMSADSWIVNLDRDTIGPEETIPFGTGLEKLPGAMNEVNVRFVLE